MARGNRDNTVRGSRDTHDFEDKQEAEVELTIRDGMKILRLVFRGVSLAVRYFEEGETEPAFESLRLGAESLAEVVGRLELDDRATVELIFDAIKREVGLMYDDNTADRLVRTLRLCFDRLGRRGFR